jgi:hypothetical protein
MNLLLLLHRFFHSLSFYVLSTLQALISLYEVAKEEVVILKPKDMVLLGLDPHNDVDFVTELGRLYFEKHIIIAGMYDTKACVACCTPKKKSGHIQL